MDPLKSKRDVAPLFGADHAVADLAEAHELVGSLTAGRMADVVIMALGVGDGELLAPTLDLLGKRGRSVIVNVHPDRETHAAVSLQNLRVLREADPRVLLRLVARLPGRQVPARSAGTWSLRPGSHRHQHVHARDDRRGLRRPTGG